MQLKLETKNASYISWKSLYYKYHMGQGIKEWTKDSL